MYISHNLSIVILNLYRYSIDISGWRGDHRCTGVVAAGDSARSGMTKPEDPPPPPPEESLLRHASLDRAVYLLSGREEGRQTR